MKSLCEKHYIETSVSSETMERFSHNQTRASKKQYERWNKSARIKQKPPKNKKQIQIFSWNLHKPNPRRQQPSTEEKDLQHLHNGTHALGGPVCKTKESADSTSELASKGTKFSRLKVNRVQREETENQRTSEKTQSPEGSQSNGQSSSSNRLRRKA